MRYNCARNNSKKKRAARTRIEAHDESGKEKTRNGEAGVMKV